MPWTFVTLADAHERFRPDEAGAPPAESPPEGREVLLRVAIPAADDLDWPGWRRAWRRYTRRTGWRELLALPFMGAAVVIGFIAQAAVFSVWIGPWLDGDPLPWPMLRSAFLALYVAAGIPVVLVGGGALGLLLATALSPRVDPVPLFLPGLCAELDRDGIWLSKPPLGARYLPWRSVHGFCDQPDWILLLVDRDPSDSPFPFLIPTPDAETRGRVLRVLADTPVERTDRVEWASLPWQRAYLAASSGVRE